MDLLSGNISDKSKGPATSPEWWTASNDASPKLGRLSELDKLHARAWFSREEKGNYYGAHGYTFFFAFYNRPDFSLGFRFAGV